MAKRIEVVHEVLEEIIDNDTDADRVVDANGFKLQMDRRFVRYLLTNRHILKKAKFASDMLQKPTNDLSNAIDLIATLKEELDACRSREKCQQFWDEAQKRCRSFKPTRRHTTCSKQTTASGFTAFFCRS